MKGLVRQAGFTLMETLFAIVILVVGLVGLANLFVVSSLSNAVAHATTTATGQAQEVMERLKATPFQKLTAGGDLDAVTPPGSIPNCDDDTQFNAATAPDGCVTPGNFNSKRSIPGVGTFQTRWVIRVIDTETYYIRVRSESAAPRMALRSRAEFSTFRSCTAVSKGCP